MRMAGVDALDDDDVDRRFFSLPGRRFLLRLAFSRSAAASCATRKACCARA